MTEQIDQIGIPRERALTDNLIAKGYDVKPALPLSEYFAAFAEYFRDIGKYDEANGAGFNSLKAGRRELEKAGLDENIHIDALEKSNYKDLMRDILDFYTSQGFNLIKHPENPREDTWEMRFRSGDQRPLVITNPTDEQTGTLRNYFICASKNPLDRIIGDN